MSGEREVKGQKLYGEPVPGYENKFVITGDEAWFLPFEDNTTAPPLFEVLTEVIDEDLSDEEVSATVDEKIEKGLLLMGYVDKETREVSLHTWPIDSGSDVEIVRERIRETFPHADHFVDLDDKRYRLSP